MHHATLGTMISLAHSINYCNSHRYTPTIVKPEEGKGGEREVGEGKHLWAFDFSSHPPLGI